MPNKYSYVPDLNVWVDPFGLKCSKTLGENLEKAGYFRPDKTAAHHIVVSGKKARLQKIGKSSKTTAHGNQMQWMACQKQKGKRAKKRMLVLKMER